MKDETLLTLAYFVSKKIYLKDSLVLIGSEIAMADNHTEFKEFENSLPGLAAFLKTNLINSLVFTNLHEYVHTQQKTTVAQNLLGQCVLEGVAELLVEKATGKYSNLPALNYGKLNKRRIEEVFSSTMFNASNGFWLYSNLENEFKVRDLGVTGIRYLNHISHF